MIENSKYLFLDVENANLNSICQIALIFADEKLNVLKEVSQLINPKSEFNYHAQKVHGITNEMVKDMPEFIDFWREFSEDFYSNIIVAHNAYSDLAMILKNLRKYDIDLVNNHILFIDTLNYFREKHREFKSYKLIDICKDCNLPVLQSHDAYNDTCMCYEVFKLYADEGIDNHLEVYEGIKEESKSEQNYFKPRLSDKTERENEIIDFLQMITSSGEVEISALYTLLDILGENTDLEGRFPYDSILNHVLNVINDGYVSNIESQEICKLAKEVSDPLSLNSEQEEMENIKIENKIFVKTGEFENGWSKEDFKKEIETRGGIVKNNITNKTDYLVVGNRGSDSWSHGNYGNKVSEAKRRNVRIIKEDEFLKQLEK